MKGQGADKVIKALNPKILGWANHYKHHAAKSTFSYVDMNIFWMVWRWAKRRHPNKGKAWIRGKYFKTLGSRQWCFCAQSEKYQMVLARAMQQRIRRYVKIRAEATPYDPDYQEYFRQRDLRN